MVTRQGRSKRMESRMAQTSGIDTASAFRGSPCGCGEGSIGTVVDRTVASTLRDCRPVPSQRPEARDCEAEEFTGASSFAVLFSLVCKVIRHMTTYHTQTGGR